MFPVRSTLKKERKQELSIFQQQAGCRFKNLDMLDIAFRHRSFSNEQQTYPINNERLEFLGDSVLGMITADILYQTYTDKPEGELAKIKAAAVSEEALSRIALTLHIDKYLILGHGEELSGGRKKKAILADALEAIIGALYLDSGFKTVRQFVSKILVPQLSLIVENKHQYRDYKSLLQEYAQKQYHVLPKYELLGKSGPKHDRKFNVTVFINCTQYGTAQGKNKKEAEQAAAEAAWKLLHSKDSPV